MGYNRLQSKARHLVDFNKSLKDRNDYLRKIIVVHKQLLSTLLEQSPPNMEVIIKKIEETIRIIDAANKTLDDENFALMSKATRYKQQIEAVGKRYSEQIDSLESKNFILINLLDKQEHIIKGFETKLNEPQKDAIEKLITDPDQQNTILQRELDLHRRNFKKLSKGLNAEINKNTKLESYSKALQAQNNSLANAIRKIYDDPNNIGSFFIHS